MRKIILRAAALLVALMALTSCFTTLALTAVALSNVVPGERVKLSGRTIQAVEPAGQCALLRTDNGSTVCIVYQFSKYKDGKRISDKFIRGGLYQYNAPDGTELYAPIFLRVKDYKKLWPIAVQLDANRQQSEDGKPQIYT